MSSTVQFCDKVIERREGESILEALVRTGSDVPFSCKKGSCHVCMLRALSGQPTPESQAGLRDSLRQRGYFLPC